MVKLKKKGESGAAANYITRNRAVRKLQISLADFRRLCILKGIYPRTPKHKKKASPTAHGSNTFYFTKDIKYLLHEPLLMKFREHKTFLKKLERALGKNQFSTAKMIQDNEPVYTLDHLIKERYASDLTWLDYHTLILMIIM
jgi:pescadillo